MQHLDGGKNAERCGWWWISDSVTVSRHFNNFKRINLFVGKCMAKKKTVVRKIYGTQQELSPL